MPQVQLATFLMGNTSNSSKLIIWLYNVKYNHFYKHPLLIRHGVKKVVFIPYAAHDHDAYETKVKAAFSKWGRTLFLKCGHCTC